MVVPSIAIAMMSEFVFIVWRCLSRRARCACHMRTDETTISDPTETPHQGRACHVVDWACGRGAGTSVNRPTLGFTNDASAGGASITNAPARSVETGQRYWRRRCSPVYSTSPPALNYLAGSPASLSLASTTQSGSLGKHARSRAKRSRLSDRGESLNSPMHLYARSLTIPSSP